MARRGQSEMICNTLADFVEGELTSVASRVGLNCGGFSLATLHWSLLSDFPAGVTQLVESQPSKLLVASSILVSRSNPPS